MEQITITEWMPAACPGTPEFEAAKAAEKKTRKPRKKRFTEKENDKVEVVKKPELTTAQLMSVRENWYALLAAIVRDWDEDLPKYNKDGSIKKDKEGNTIWEHRANHPDYPYYQSADDALAAMGVRRQYNSK